MKREKGPHLQHSQTRKSILAKGRCKVFMEKVKVVPPCFNPSSWHCWHSNEYQYTFYQWSCIDVSPLSVTTSGAPAVPATTETATTTTTTASISTYPSGQGISSCQDTVCTGAPANTEKVYGQILSQCEALCATTLSCM